MIMFRLIIAMLTMFCFLDHGFARYKTRKPQNLSLKIDNPLAAKADVTTDGKIEFSWDSVYVPFFEGNCTLYEIIIVPAATELSPDNSLWGKMEVPRVPVTPRERNGYPLPAHREKIRINVATELKERGNPRHAKLIERILSGERVLLEMRVRGYKELTPARQSDIYYNNLWLTGAAYKHPPYSNERCSFHIQLPRKNVVPAIENVKIDKFKEGKLHLSWDSTPCSIYQIAIIPRWQKPIKNNKENFIVSFERPFKLTDRQEEVFDLSELLQSIDKVEDVDVRVRAAIGLTKDANGKDTGIYDSASDYSLFSMKPVPFKLHPMEKSEDETKSVKTWHLNRTAN